MTYKSTVRLTAHQRLAYGYYRYMLVSCDYDLLRNFPNRRDLFGEHDSRIEMTITGWARWMNLSYSAASRVVKKLEREGILIASKNTWGRGTTYIFAPTLAQANETLQSGSDVDLAFYRKVVEKWA